MNAVNQLGEMKRPSLLTKNLNKLYIAEFDRPACSICIYYYINHCAVKWPFVCVGFRLLFSLCVCVSYFFGKKLLFLFYYLPVVLSDSLSWKVSMACTTEATSRARWMANQLTVHICSCWYLLTGETGSPPVVVGLKWGWHTPGGISDLIGERGFIEKRREEQTHSKKRGIKI